MAAQQQAPAPPITTIVPFNDRSKLPECAAACGPLYDANGGCVPPAIPQGPLANYQDCFCHNSNVQGFATSNDQVCPQACPNDPNGLKSIGAWYSSLCNIKEGQGQAPPQTSTAAGGDSRKGSSNNNSGNRDWISTHYQWVIFIVVMVVGIAGIWVGACIWRRRHLRKKQRQSTIGQKHSGSTNHPSWGPPLQNSEDGVPVTYSSKGGLPSIMGRENRKSKNKSTM